MPLILAIEPDKKQSNRIAAIARGPLQAELVIAGTSEAALEQLGTRTPDLILTAQLLSPKDEAALDQRLHELDAAGSRVQTLVIPVLSAPARRAKGDRGLLTRLRRPVKDGSPASHGCDPAIFAAQITEYLDRAAAERAAALKEASDLEDDVPMDVAVPVDEIAAETVPAAVEIVTESAADEHLEAPEQPETVDAPEPTVAHEADPFAISLDADLGGLSLDELPEFELVDIDPLEGAEISWAGEIDKDPITSENEEDAWEELALPTGEAQPTAAAAVPTAELPVATAFHAPQIIQAESIDLARFISEFTDDLDFDGELHTDAAPEILLHFAPSTPEPEPAVPMAARPAVTASRQSDAEATQWMPPPASFHLWWPPLEGVSAEDPDAVDTMAAADSDVAGAAAAPAAPAVLEMLTAIRRDLDLLKHGRDEAPGDPHDREREATIRAMMPSLDVDGDGRSAADQSHAGPPRKAKRKAATTPPQDEWGFFDPEQCGFAALLAKLEEITESKATAARHD